MVGVSNGTPEAMFACPEKDIIGNKSEFKSFLYFTSFCSLFHDSLPPPPQYSLFLVIMSPHVKSLKKRPEGLVTSTSSFYFPASHHGIVSCDNKNYISLSRDLCNFFFVLPEVSRLLSRIKCNNILFSIPFSYSTTTAETTAAWEERAVTTCYTNLTRPHLVLSHSNVTSTIIMPSRDAHTCLPASPNCQATLWPVRQGTYINLLISISLPSSTTCHHVKHQIPFDSRLITIIVRHLSARRLLTNMKSPVTGLNGPWLAGCLPATMYDSV